MCPSVPLAVHLSLYLRLCVYDSMYRCVCTCPPVLPVFLCCPSVFLSVFLLIYLFIVRPPDSLSLSIYQAVCFLFCHFICLCVCFFCLSIYIYIYFFSSPSCPVCVCDAHIDKNLLFAGQDTWTQNLSLSGRPSRSRCCLFSEPKSAKFYPQHSVTGPPAPTGNLPQTHVYPRTRASLHL